MKRKVFTISTISLNILLVFVVFVVFVKISPITVENRQLNLENSQLKEQLEASIDIKAAETADISKIAKYISANYRRIPSSTVKLIAENVVKCSNRFQIPISVVVGVIEIESGFNPSQVSKAKARGLMQVRWGVWKETLSDDLGMKNEFDLHEIDKGIIAGITVLRYYIDKHNGDMSGALYDYVGKSDGYSAKVYKAMGRFMLFN